MSVKQIICKVTTFRLSISSKRLIKEFEIATFRYDKTFFEIIAVMSI